MNTAQHRIVVVGGGINGLSAAWSAWLASGAGPVEVCLLEASCTVGGKAKTRHLDGFLFEEGPTGYLSGDATLDRLIELAKLEALPARTEAARRYVLHGQRLREIKSNPLAFARSGILSPLGLLRMAREPWIPIGNDEEESVWHFAERRLGREVADRLIAPMVLGVFAGDAKQLSLSSAFPRMAEMEREHGSLIRAMIHLMKSRKQHGGPAGPAGSLHSFADGMQSLPLGLAQQAPFEVRCESPVTSIERAHDSWQLNIRGQEAPLRADQLILACEAKTSARLLQPHLPGVSLELDQLNVPGVAVVGLAYPAAANFPTGFGVLIARNEGFRTLGCLFDSQLFPGRCPKDSRLVRCLIGGATDPEASRLSEEELTRLAADDVQRLFDLNHEAQPIAVMRHQGAIPQYELGHAKLLGRIEEQLQAATKRLPGLHLSGCHRAGVAFGKTAREGWNLGEFAAANL